MRESGDTVARRRLPVQKGREEEIHNLLLPLSASSQSIGSTAHFVYSFIERRPFLLQTFILDLSKLSLRDIELLRNVLARLRHAHQAEILSRNQRVKDF